jgi:hypothetical protein
MSGNPSRVQLSTDFFTIVDRLLISNKNGIVLKCEIDDVNSKQAHDALINILNTKGKVAVTRKEAPRSQVQHNASLWVLKYSRLSPKGWNFPNST